WYKKYKNDANGIIFMNEEGFDRVLVGENLADPNVGVRPYEVSGILVNNKQGWERVGGGVNTGQDGKSRQGFGVDDDSGEAMHLVTFEDGSKALILSDENGLFTVPWSTDQANLMATETAHISKANCVGADALTGACTIPAPRHGATAVLIDVSSSRVPTDDACTASNKATVSNRFFMVLCLNVKVK
nr:hypothetical protein [Thermoflexibacter sp.]